MSGSFRMAKYFWKRIDEYFDLLDRHLEQGLERESHHVAMAACLDNGDRDLAGLGAGGFSGSCMHRVGRTKGHGDPPAEETISMEQLSNVKIIIMIQSSLAQTTEHPLFGGPKGIALIEWMASLKELKLVVLQGSKTLPLGKALVSRAHDRRLDVLCWKTNVEVNVLMRLDKDLITKFLENALDKHGDPLRRAIDICKTNVKTPARPQVDFYEQRIRFQDTCAKENPLSIGFPMLLSSDSETQSRYEVGNQLEVGIWGKQSHHVSLYENGFTCAVQELRHCLRGLLKEPYADILNDEKMAYVKTSTMYLLGALMGWISHLDSFFQPEEGGNIVTLSESIKKVLQGYVPKWKSVGNAMTREWKAPPSIIPYIKFRRRIEYPDCSDDHQFINEVAPLVELFDSFRAQNEKGSSLSELVNVLLF